MASKSETGTAPVRRESLHSDQIKIAKRGDFYLVGVSVGIYAPIAGIRRPQPCFVSRRNREGWAASSWSDGDRKLVAESLHSALVLCSTIFMYPTSGQIWRHHKTEGEYEIVGIARLQVKTTDLDMKECVIYKALDDGKLWVRPLEDFLESIDGGEGSRQRFSFVR